MPDLMKKHIITIGGYPGSGKSSTAKGVAAALRYEHFSSGDRFRELAAERGISVEQINLTAEAEKEIDLQVDEWLKNLYQTRENMVIDSRMAFRWMPDAFKVYLDLEPHLAAERTLSHIQKEGRVGQTGSSVEEILRNTAERVASERKRYDNLYGVNVYDKNNFDLIVDTAANGLEQVIAIVTAAYTKWLGEG